jgi:spore germination cell wall hydrolase CwlJ-like protein
MLTLLTLAVTSLTLIVTLTAAGLAKESARALEDAEARIAWLERQWVRSELEEPTYTDAEIEGRQYTDAEIDMLLRVVAAEARGTSALCQIAVCETILNRAALWGMTLTEVMTANAQFAAPYREEVPQLTKDAAAACLDGARAFGVPVTHFHNDSVSPYWAASKTFAGQIDNVLFYY